VIDPAGRPDRPSPLRVTARCGSCRLLLQRLTASSRRSSTVSRARTGSRGVRVPFRGLCCRPSSASLACGASPLAVTTGLGVFLDLLDSRDRSHGRSSPGVRVPFRAEPRLGCPRSGLATSAYAFATCRPKLGIRLSWSSRSREHFYAGCPVRPTPALRQEQVGWRSPNPHQCRPQGSCPSRRFWPRSRHARTPCGARRSPWRPDASRPSFMPLAPLESPFRAFPSRGAVPALAGLLLPCGFALDRPTARLDPRYSRPLSPIAPTLRHGWPEGSPDWKAVTSVPWSR